MSRHLFAYGTLQPEFAPPKVRHILQQFQLIAPGRTPGSLYNLGEYPGAKFDDAAMTEVHGVVYALPDDNSIWKALDEYEGVPSMYVRVRRPVTLEDDTQRVCWAYAYQRPVNISKLIASGRYRR